jgi:hypothetical protein
MSLASFMAATSFDVMDINPPGGDPNLGTYQFPVPEPIRGYDSWLALFHRILPHFRAIHERSTADD